MQKGILFILIQGILCSSQVFSQSAANPVSYSLPRQVYTQVFDGLPSSGTFSLTGKGPFNLSNAPVNAQSMEGWQFLQTGGSNTNAVFLVSTGSSTGSGTQSLGTGNNTERSLGSLSSGSGTYCFGLILTNQTGIPLNSITLNFTAEQWRKGGSGNKNTWTFKYKTGQFVNIDQPDLLEEPKLNFSSLLYTTGAGSTNGNLPEYQQMISFTIMGITWKTGEQLLLRWDDADEPGNDDACAIDNFSFSARQVASPPSIGSLQSTEITAHGARLNASVNDNYAFTRLSMEYDTSRLFLSPKIIPPLPDTLSAGTGITKVSALLDSLKPGTVYYFRVKATNSLGSIYSEPWQFSTLVSLPEISSIIMGIPTNNAASLGGIIYSTGGSMITEKGVLWSVSNPPTLSSNKILMGNGSEDFLQTITGLLQGSVLYARAYATNAAGSVLGNIISFTTQTTISSLTALSTSVTNSPTVSFTLKTAQPVTGLKASHFSILTDGIQNVSIVSIAGSGNTYTIVVNTGTGDGNIRLSLTQDEALTPLVYNKPYLSTNYYTIDKSPPIIQQVSLPDKPMKTGDTIPVTISVKPDPAQYKIVTGTIHKIPISGLVKKNDSLYTCYFIIKNNGIDLGADQAISVNLSMSDPLGNISSTYMDPIVQSNDPIDANQPNIAQMKIQTDKVYRSGDTLLLSAIFSEPVSVNSTNGIPYIKLQIGNSSRQAFYNNGSGTTTLQFFYIIQPTDEDSVGMKTGNSILLNNGSIRDYSYNNALLDFSTTIVSSPVLIDGVAPKVNLVVVPLAGTYTIQDTLEFIVRFTEKINLSTRTDTPFLKLTIGSSIKNMACYSGLGTESLYFRYIIQKNDLDKNGLTLGNLSVSIVNTLTDLHGNPASLSLKNIGNLSNIKIDAVWPQFISSGITSLWFCETDSFVSLTDALMVMDEDKTDTITWRIYPSNGSLGIEKKTLATLSSGGKSSPGIVTYMIADNPKRLDTITVTVSDGIHETTKTIILGIQSQIKNNSLQAYPYICSSNQPPAIIGSFPTGGNGLYEYLWEYAGISDSANYIKAIGSNSLKDYQPPKMSGNTWFRRKVVSGACSDISSSIKLTPIKSGLWMGNNNTDWKNKNNWCGNLVPDLNTDVFIPSGTAFYPTISDTAFGNQLSMDTKTFFSVKGVLQINGNIQSDPNAINCKEGTLVLSGSSRQNISGKNFVAGSLRKLVINNSDNASITDTLQITGSLQLLNGILETNQQLLISQSATIGPSASGSLINGNVSIEKILPLQKRQFLLMGHPLSKDIELAMITDSLSSNGSAVFETELNNNDSNRFQVFRYDPLLVTDSLAFDEHWIPFTHSDGLGENAWKKYSGIRVLLHKKERQNSNNDPPNFPNNPISVSQSALVKFIGPVNTGDLEIHLQKGMFSGYQIISNPYVSPIEVSLTTRGSGVANHFWVWNLLQGRAGGYTSIPFKSRYVLAPFEAIIVKATSNANSTILFTENCKTNARESDSLPLVNGIDAHYLELRLESDSIFYDRWILFYSDSAKNNFDKQDAEKISNPEMNLYSFSKEEKQLSIDTRPVNNESEIQLGIQSGETGRFRLRVAKTNLPASNTLQIHDKLLNQWMEIEKDSCYYFEITADTASFGDHRFEITSRKPEIESLSTESKLIASISPIPATEKINIQYRSTEPGLSCIRILDFSGNVQKKIPLGIQKEGKVQVSIHNLSAGIYFIQVISGDQNTICKMIKN